MTFTTIYTSNATIDCHILRGRLVSDGVDAFIYDENIVWVNPFYAVAIGGVKLNVPNDQIDRAKLILDSINNNMLTDEIGSYDIQEALNAEITRQNEILELKSMIRKDQSLLDKVGDIKSDKLTQSDISELIKGEIEFNDLVKKHYSFSLNQFWYELFDFDRSVFRYLRPKSVDYYLDKELVDKYQEKSENIPIRICPNCNSDNVSYGYAIDYKWDILYLILSIISVPFPLFRKKYHCHNCKNDFKHSKQGNRTPMA
jgi:hypothetical protein